MLGAWHPFANKDILHAEEGLETIYPYSSPPFELFNMCLNLDSRPTVIYNLDIPR